MLPSTAALSRLSSIDTIIREVNPLPSLVLLLGRLITEFPPPQLLSPGSHPSTPVLERLIPPLHKSHNCRRQVYLQVPADLSTSSNTSIERLILTIGGTLSNVPKHFCNFNQVQHTSVSTINGSSIREVNPSSPIRLGAIQ